MKILLILLFPVVLLAQGFGGYGFWNGYASEGIKAAYFDGSDTHLWIDDGAETEDLRPHLDDFTVEIWFKTGDDVATSQYLQSFRAGGHGYAYWVRIISGTVTANIDDGVVTITTSTTIETNTKYYLCAVYDRDANLSLYLTKLGDTIGSPATVDISSMSAIDLDQASRDFALGAFGTISGGIYTGNTFMGYMVEFRYSNTLRDPNTSYNCQSTLDANHKAVWRFTDADWLTDRSGNNNTLNNTNVTQKTINFNLCSKWW